MTPTEPQVEAITGKSVLGHLKDRRQEIASAQVLHRKVPRWTDPEIWVMYQPVDFDPADKARREADKVQGPAQSTAILLANVDCLILACVGVYAILPDDEERTHLSLRPNEPNGELTKFDKELAVALGLNSQATARQVVRTLFITEGDILNHAGELAKFSGYAGGEVDVQLGES